MKDGRPAGASTTGCGSRCGDKLARRRADFARRVEVSLRIVFAIGAKFARAAVIALPIVVLRARRAVVHAVLLRAVAARLEIVAVVVLRLFALVGLAVVAVALVRLCGCGGCAA